jgi:DNA-binding PadR family transcriptional regulator
LKEYQHMRHHHHRNHEDRGQFERRDPRAMFGEGRRERHGRGFGRPGDRSEEGRGRRRMFDGGELRLVMLLLMEAEPRHGYDIIREIETRTGGAYAPSPGIIYPTLTLLEEIGQVEARASEGAKKLFAITPAGVEQLNAHRTEAEAALARLDALGAKDEALDQGPVHRAISNLKVVLRQRLSGPADRAMLLAVADVIDEAARKIERL